MFSFLKSLMKIGFFSYGGGNAIIPFLHKEFVRTGKISEDEYNKNILLTNVTPGTAQVKLASSSAYSSGIWISALSAYAIALPSFLLVVALLSIYTLFSVSLVEQINQFTVGIYIFVVFILIKYIRSGFESIDEADRKFSWIAFFTVIFLTVGNELSELMSFFIPDSGVIKSLGKLSLDNIYVFFGAFFIAIILTKIRKSQREDRIESHNFNSPVKLLGIFGLFSFIVILPTFYYDLTLYYLSVFVSTLTSFGGGSAYISTADSFFVQTGMIPEDYFYAVILLIAYALPGPTLTKVVSGIGFYIGYQLDGIFAGFLVAFVSLTLSIFATNLIFILAQWVYGKYANVSLFKNLKMVILPVIYGILVVTILTVINLSMQIIVENGVTPLGSILFIIGSLVVIFNVSRRFKMNETVLVLLCGLYSFVMVNAF